jgi:hypothetical protein
MRGVCCGAELEDMHLQACARLEGEAAAAAQREAERRDAEGRLQEEAAMLRRTLGAAQRPPSPACCSFCTVCTAGWIANTWPLQLIVTTLAILHKRHYCMGMDA